MNDEALEIYDNQFLRQFETTIGTEKVLIEYSAQDRKIFLTKVVASPQLIEKGLEENFIMAVLKIIEGRKMRVVPKSPIIAKFMKKNRSKYKAMLPTGVTL